MPTYDYECTKCKHRFELFHSITDDEPKRCPRCKAKAKRVPTAGAGLLFKGSGFYITDYRSDSYKERAKEEGAKTAATGGSGGADAPASKSGEAGKSADSSGASAGGGAKEKPTSSRRRSTPSRSGSTRSSSRSRSTTSRTKKSGR